jgi:uncharacterized membrane protein
MNMIENSDRGFTVNKGLAWTIGTGLISAGVYVGLTIASLTSALDTQNSQILEARASRSGLEQRVRALENGAAGNEVQFRNINASLDDLKAAQRETNALLRQLTKP